MGNLNIDSQMPENLVFGPPKLAKRSPCRHFFVGAKGLGFT